MNLDTATGAMIGEQVGKLVVGKTTTQLQKKFGYLKSPFEAHPYVRACCLESPCRDSARISGLAALSATLPVSLSGSGAITREIRNQLLQVRVLCLRLFEHGIVGPLNPLVFFASWCVRTECRCAVLPVILSFNSNSDRSAILP
jgi:hypothetical protein